MNKLLAISLLTLFSVAHGYSQQNKLWGIPIEPNILSNKGILNVELKDDEFDAEGSWEQTWRIWMPGRGKPNSSSGYLNVIKSLNPDNTLNFLVTQVISEDNSWVHSTLAKINAENNPYSTPATWKKSSRFHTNPATGSRHLPELDTYNEGDLSMPDADEESRITASFTLFDVVQRMSNAGLDMLEFTLLDELDKIKKKHKIRFKEESSIVFAGKERKVRVYQGKGEGSLPWIYYIDEKGRLLLAISGMRTFILDPEVKNEYADRFSHTFSDLDNVKKTYRKEGLVQEHKKPNILFITTDQQTWSSLSQSGNAFLHTPNLDRLAQQGYAFYGSYSPNPVCSPTRATWLTGLTSSENGVISNGLSIIEGIETVADKVSNVGYETVFAGKLHVGIPSSYGQEIPGFSKVLCEGIGGKGTLGDQVVSSVVEGYLQNRDAEKPFFLSVNFLQPHDICNWISRFSKDKNNPFSDLIDEQELPPLPENHITHFNEPRMDVSRMADWSKEDWRFYLWNYYRMIEEVDAEIGRVLKALEKTGEKDNTVIIFTSDHGEGAGHHQSVMKNFPYDEACKVPLIISYPKELDQGVLDTEHLVSGLDVVPTICDFAGVENPANAKGLSLRPLAMGSDTDWRSFLVSEIDSDKGRMLRSAQYKLIVFRDDPEILFFDMKNDPGETKNLAKESEYKDELIRHIQMLEEWESTLVSAPNAKGSFQVFR